MKESSPTAIITTPAHTERVRREPVGIGSGTSVIAVELPSVTKHWDAKGVIGYLTKLVTAEMLQTMMRRFGDREMTILLVDDDPDFARLLEAVGIADTFVRTAPDPEALMDACGLGVADLVAATRRALARKHG